MFDLEALWRGHGEPLKLFAKCHAANTFHGILNIEQDVVGTPVLREAEEVVAGLVLETDQQVFLDLEYKVMCG